MSDDLFGPPKKRSAGRLTLLLVLALLASGAANAWLWQERQRAIADGKSAIGRLAAAETTARELTLRVQEMQGESIALAEGKTPPARDAGAEADGLARPSGSHEAIATVDAGKKPEPKDEIAKDSEAKAEKPDREAKAKPEAEGTDEKEAAPEAEKKPKKPEKAAKRAKPARSAKAAKPARSAKAAKPAPHKKAGARPESPSVDREL